MEKLWPITLTRKISDIHCGGFTMAEEESLSFKAGELFEAPNELFELVTFHKKNLSTNLNKYKEVIIKNNDYTEVRPGVFAHAGAVIDEQVVFNTKNGLVIIEKGAHINPFNYISGPVRIDESATINPHSNISNSYIGKYCKVGGEVSNSIIESYSNKGHHGYLGDSYVGSWVNIGGGASTSNLKNTYGKIKLGGVETGEQFLGSIIADHAKIAINVSIYTGKIIGTGAHIYGTVETDVPKFVNYFNKDKMTEIPIEITEKIAERMMSRRKVQFTEEDKKMLKYAYTII
ncbi:MAG: hypothetical protein KBD48_02450 [Candidatus Pacebacteria bacterium]|nr:hypothetical protein [Candidatus Paceibacterota bacterium]MBP9716024.1 hypothetical protein [Candidatus Paceibacterota bacterium]